MALDTTPASWVAGEIPTALKLNTEIRDALVSLQAGWVPYTPTWTASVTNPVIGNGSLAGAYHRIGKTIFFRLLIAMGSTTTYGNGNYSLGLPVPMSAAISELGLSIAVRVTDSGNTSYSFELPSKTSSQAISALRATNFTGGLAFLSHAVPMAWAVNDTIVAAGHYEAA